MALLARSLAPAAGQGPLKPALQDVARVNAPLFRKLVESLSTERRSVVLDLGPVRPATVALLTPFRCRLEIVSLADGLAALESTEGLEGPPDPGLLWQRVDALLPPPRPEPVDIVLCWDLLNYLGRPALTALMDRVAARMRPGGLLHALIAYSSPQMPEAPSQFSPHADGVLEEAMTTTRLRNSPRYSAEDMRRCLRGFRSDGGTLLKNGMQELLFRA